MKKLTANLFGKIEIYVWLAVSLLWVSTAVHAEVSVSGSLVEDTAHECLIEPNRVLKLGSETQGLVDVLEVDRGDFVKAGDVVARLRSTVERGRVEQARKRAAMKGEINARRADLELASIVLKRSGRLHKQALIPSQELDEARAQHRVAQAALRQAEDTADQLKLDLVRAEALLAQRIIRSPIDGVVVEQHAFAGEYVQDNPVMTIAQLDPLRVEVVLPLNEFGRYSVGDSAVVKPELGGSAVTALVDIVDPLLDASSGTFGVRLLLDNSKGHLVAGQKCEITIKAANPE